MLIYRVKLLQPPLCSPRFSIKRMSVKETKKSQILHTLSTLIRYNYAIFYPCMGILLLQQ